MKLTLEFTKHEARLLSKLASHIDGDIESMGDPSESADQRRIARDLEGARDLLRTMLRNARTSKASSHV